MSINSSSIPKDVTVDNTSLTAADNVIGVKEDGITEPLIKNGEIINDDLNSSADIEPSKLTRQYSLSDDVLQSHDADINVSDLSMTKQKTITLDTLKNSASNVRVYFEYKSYNAGTTIFAQVYKNGVALGTLKSTNSTDWQTWSEDLEFNSGDTIELWAYVNNATDQAHLRYFRVLGKNEIVPLSASGFEATNS